MQKIPINKPLERVIFLGRKPLAVEAAKFLLGQNIQITLIVCPSIGKDAEAFSELGKKHNITVLNDGKALYQMIKDGDERIKNVDLVISYLYPRRIKMPLINLASLGCVNFHPAPLPDYKSRAGYNTAILENKKEFGVSAHFIDSEEFDAGPIIKVLRFPIAADEKVMDLVEKTQEKLLVLFKEVILNFQKQSPIEVLKNKDGLYLTGAELESLKAIDPGKDSLEETHRKIRAFFYPPYHGATIKIKGEKFTLVDEDTLRYLAKKLGL